MDIIFRPKPGSELIARNGKRYRIDSFPTPLGDAWDCLEYCPDLESFEIVSSHDTYEQACEWISNDVCNDVLHAAVVDGPGPLREDPNPRK